MKSRIIFSLLALVLVLSGCAGAAPVLESSTEPEVSIPESEVKEVMDAISEGSDLTATSESVSQTEPEIIPEPSESDESGDMLPADSNHGREESQNRQTAAAAEQPQSSMQPEAPQVTAPPATEPPAAEPSVTAPPTAEPETAPPSTSEAAPDPVETEPEIPKTIYDYEFDVSAIRSELIALGQSLGLTHITEDDGVPCTPDNCSWATPVTASESFQGDKLKRALRDYVSSMPTLLASYGGTQISCFTIYVQENGGGSYTFYFLY